MKDSTEFKIAVARSYTAMYKNIQDEVLTTRDVEQKSRFRKTLIVLDENILSKDYNKGFSLRDIYEEVIEMISVDLKSGYNFPVISMEVFDHQARDWFLMKLEAYSTVGHPWRNKLKENNKNVIACVIGFGNIQGSSLEDTPADELALLPITYCQLINFETEEGVILEAESWNIQKDGVLIQPEFLKQFGRYSPDTE